MLKLLVNLNGMLGVYVMGVVNAVLVCVEAFGVSLTSTQIGTITTLTNAILVLIIHIATTAAANSKVAPSG